MHCENALRILIIIMHFIIILCVARLTGVGGDKQHRNGRGQGGATAVGLHGGHGVRGRLQDAMRGARRRQVLRADQGLDVRVGHVRRALNARVPGGHGLPLPHRRRATNVPAQDRGRRRTGPLQRGRFNRFARSANRGPSARASAVFDAPATLQQLMRFCCSAVLKP